MTTRRLFPILLTIFLGISASCGTDRPPPTATAVPAPDATRATTPESRITPTPEMSPELVEPGLLQSYYNKSADISLWLPNEWAIGDPADEPAGQTTLVEPRPEAAVAAAGATRSI